MTPLVLKIGGSLAETGRLRAMLALVGRARRQVVVVPGGGPFADAVRDAQSRLGLSDAVAHDMAILAMEQMAAAMIDLTPRFVPAATPLAMTQAWRGRRIPVWMPAKLCADDSRIPRDWSITSDGLAARLAERLRGAEVVLVKSCTMPRSASPETLARRGIVDPVFPAIVRRAALSWRVLGPGNTATLVALIGATDPMHAPVKRGPATRAGCRRPSVQRFEGETAPCRVSSRRS